MQTNCGLLAAGAEDALLVAGFLAVSVALLIAMKAVVAGVKKEESKP